MYAVYSYDKWQAQFPNAVPAGRYDKLNDAIKHAETVTYKMIVVDSKAESRGFIYCNWETAPQSSPWGVVQHSKRLAAGIWSVSTSSHGGIWLSQDRLSQLTAALGGEYPTFCGADEWFEEDCDWCLPALAFAADIDDPAMAATAERQLASMAKHYGSDSKYARACSALRGATAPLGWESVEA